jgi:hypothetical protein
MAELPDDIDAALWIRCSKTGDRDFLVERNPHTFPGRMAAFCPHDEAQSDYNVSVAEVEECSAEARIWMRGFVVGGEPGAPLDDEGFEIADTEALHRDWDLARSTYRESGYWPPGAPRRP